jgi:hypothetical protein
VKFWNFSWKFCNEKNNNMNQSIIKQMIENNCDKANKNAHDSAGSFIKNVRLSPYSQKIECLVSAPNQLSTKLKSKNRQEAAWQK